VTLPISVSPDLRAISTASMERRYAEFLAEHAQNMAMNP